jgi:AbrB family looped-hinge helix DNA binding protein
MPRITSKGQVTIPRRIRDYLGLKPGSWVEFHYAGDGRIMLRAEPGVEAKTRDGRERQRVEKALAALRGSAGPGLSTDEVMRLTRGWGEPDYDVK